MPRNFFTFYCYKSSRSDGLRKRNPLGYALVVISIDVTEEALGQCPLGSNVHSFLGSHITPAREHALVAYI